MLSHWIVALALSGANYGTNRQDGHRPIDLRLQTTPRTTTRLRTAPPRATEPSSSDLAKRDQSSPKPTSLSVPKPQSPLSDVASLWNRLVGQPTTADTDSLADGESFAEEDIEFVPLVLVIGATGRTGRIIVRKLLLRGFRVAVLVRDLSSKTLNLLGTGVSYSYGDVADYDSLLNAMEDVDKVVCAASPATTEAEQAAEEEATRNVLRAFQDTRTYTYGSAEATKLSLAKFRRDSDFDAWSIESSADEVARRLADAGLASKPSIAYWKRSEAHANAVFVGRIFDQFFGFAVASCTLCPTGIRLASDDEADEVVDGDDANTGDLDDALLGDGFTLGEYSGLILKAIGDGQTYTMIARTALYESDGIEYHLDFQSSNKTFAAARLPFAAFVPSKQGRPLPKDVSVPELDRRSLTGLAIGFFPMRNAKSEFEGSFYLSLKFIKAYRERDEPEFVYISRAGSEATLAVEGDKSAAAAAAADDLAPLVSPAAETSSLSVTERCERVIVSSGLTYFIMRPAALDDMPGGVRRIVLTQESALAPGTVSRTDVAEVAVRSLLDPRACNVACTISESAYLAPTDERQDISKMLEVLKPEHAVAK